VMERSWAPFSHCAKRGCHTGADLARLELGRHLVEHLRQNLRQVARMREPLVRPDLDARMTAAASSGPT